LSPDGKQIAFVSPHQNHWKVFVVPTEGGGAQELLPEAHDDELDPAWSADGKRLVFGHNADRGLSLEMVDLQSRQASNIPKSEKLFSPRWSPDGRYIAAMSADSLNMFLFDMATQTWSDPISDNAQIGFPNWSGDSKDIYFDESGPDPSFRRLHVGSKSTEKLFSLRDIRLFNHNIIGTWTGVAPDGTPLFTRDSSTQEIYALDVEWP
jgi:Tol biopolymer transport system component